MGSSEVTVWKDHPTIPNVSVSTDGRVKNTARNREYTRWVCKQTGYIRVSLSFKDKRMVHRLVAETFIGDATGLQVNHKNGVKDDNNIANLELVTHQQNMRHAADVLGHFYGNKNMPTKYTDAEVREMRRLRASGMMLKDIAKLFNSHKTTVCAICKGRSRKAVA